MTEIWNIVLNFFWAHIAYLAKKPIILYLGNNPKSSSSFSSAPEKGHWCLMGSAFPCYQDAWPRTGVKDSWMFWGTLLRKPVFLMKCAGFRVCLSTVSTAKREADALNSCFRIFTYVCARDPWCPHACEGLCSFVGQAHSSHPHWICAKSVQSLQRVKKTCWFWDKNVCRI